MKYTQRKTSRLRHYDYRSSGAYFVTFKTHNSNRILGSLKSGKVHLSVLGEIVLDEWKNTFARRKNLTIDAFTIMPNHFHAVLWIPPEVRNQTFCPERFGRPVTGSLSTIIRAFKSAATQRIRELNPDFAGPVWQSRYYDVIIRSESQLNAIRKYINKHPPMIQLSP